MQEEIPEQFLVRAHDKSLGEIAFRLELVTRSCKVRHKMTGRGSDGNREKI